MQKMSNSLSLENAFFMEQDQALIKKLQELKMLQESKEALRLASGIQDDHLLERLVELHVTPQTLAALTAIPLIETAWADGSVDLKEKGKILEALERHGIKKSTIEHDLVELWLSHKPDEKLFVAWEEMIKEICIKMNKDDLKKFHASLMDDTQAVAQASGGFLGMKKISPEEKKTLDRLNKAFSFKS